jgi:putative nucleotidyltransferase with HDIG domain
MFGRVRPDTSHMRWGWSAARCWPYMVVATAFVAVMPACVASLVAPSASALHVLGALLIALVVSMAAAKLGAALWMRHPLARDVVFADLMAWEWLRRLWLERRLDRAQRRLSARDDAAPHKRAETLSRFARLLEARDAYTHGHSQRVARHAVRIARALHVPAHDATRIWTAATLHDIGKIRTPREILNKPGGLSDAEFDVIKRHPVDGAAMLAGIGDPEIVAIVRSHHERLDGAGYPDGLAGTDIPLGSRIIAVADTFDALTSTRSYRSAASHKRALDILRKEAGAQLDAAAVAAFLRTYSGRRPAAWSAAFTVAPQRLISWLGHQVPGVGALAPAAGWIAPAAAAAAALGISSQAIDDAPTRASSARAPVAAVRSAHPSSASSLVAPRRTTSAPDRGAAPTGGARRHPARRRPRAPAAALDGAASAQTLATPASGSVATPTATEPSTFPEVKPVTDAIAGVKAPPAPAVPAVDPGALPVHAPSLPTPPLAAVAGAGSTIVTDVQSAVPPAVSAIIPPP